MIDDQLIFDIGMHVGDDTAYFLKLGYRVIAVEANPHLAAAGKKNFAGYIQKKQLTIIDKGISNDVGKFSFWVNNKNSVWSSFDKELAHKENTTVTEVVVETITLQDLFKSYGVPYYLKIDIEGNDIFCVKSIDPANRPKYVSCEANTVELLETLHAKGYTKFKLINQANGFYPYSWFNETFYIPSLISKIFWKIRKSLFRTALPYGDTGPFGEETRGSWKSFSEIKKQFLSYYKGSDFKPINKLSWYDFHATY